MTVKYYEINNCVVHSTIDENTGVSKHYIYAPNNVPIEVLQRYKFEYDGHSKVYWKMLSNAEVSEITRNMSPDNSYSVVGNGKYVSEDDRKLSRKLCIASLIMLLIPEVAGVIIAVIGALTTNIVSDDGGLFASFSSLFGLLLNMCPIAGIIMLVVAKFKDPNSKFAKALIIVYIVCAVLYILALIVAAMACGLGMAACLNELQNCSG